MQSKLNTRVKLLNGTIINRQYQILNLIASGSFGNVYESVNIESTRRVALKVEKLINNTSTLRQEYNLLLELQGVKGIPNVVWFGREHGQSILATELLEKDLSMYMRIYKKLSLNTVLQLGIQLTNILEKVHKKGILHRDVKPENIVYGPTSTFYLLDFGISKYYRSEGKQIPFTDNKHFVGTSRYASLAAHNGVEQSPKDDLESLIFVLIFCLRGFLPWEFCKDIKEVLQQKESIHFSQLFFGIPKQINDVFQYLKRLTYYDVPNYQYIVHLLNQAAKDCQLQLNERYEWRPNETKDNSRGASLTLFKDLPPKSLREGKRRSVTTINKHQLWIDDDLVNLNQNDDDDDEEGKHIIADMNSRLPPLQFNKPNFI